MTAPTKPAAKPGSNAGLSLKDAPRAGKATIDFGALTVAEVTEPLRSTRDSVTLGTPVPGWLEASAKGRKLNADGTEKASWQGAAKAVTVPGTYRKTVKRTKKGVEVKTDEYTGQAKALVYVLRKAAEERNEGVRIVPKSNGNSTVTITFAAKNRRVHKSAAK